ncbi:MAG: hypothetical protein TREMPRED_005992, partial [Tremellales sp. Tagirdzhanova-0007]
MPSSPTRSPTKLRHHDPPHQTSRSHHRTVSPRLQRAKSKGKDTDRERSLLQREIGSATISLRQDMVERLVNEDDAELDLPGPSRPRLPSGVGSDKLKPRKTSTSHIAPPSVPSVRSRRPRANSVHLPSQVNGVDRSFYLSHYSTDQRSEEHTSELQSR